MGEQGDHPARKAADECRQTAVEQLKQVRYFWNRPTGSRSVSRRRLRDVAGLVKLVDRAEIEANDWSLTPGRYVGVAPEEVDEDFDFEEALRDIHVELEDLNAEAADWREDQEEFRGVGGMRWAEARLINLVGFHGQNLTQPAARCRRISIGGPFPFIQTGDVKHAGLYLRISQTYSDAVGQSKLWPARYPVHHHRREHCRYGNSWD